MMRLWIMILGIVLFPLYGYASDNLRVRYNAGETLIYSLKMFGLKVGIQKLQILPYKTKYYKIYSETKNTSLLSKIYFIHNKIETHISREKLLPIYIKEDIYEGRYRRYSIIELDQKNHTGTITVVKTSSGRYNKKRLISILPATLNLPGLIYYLRSRKDLSQNKVLSIGILKQYQAKKVDIKVECYEDVYVPYGKFSAIKIKEASGNIVLWITNDKNRLPVKIECITTPGWRLVAELTNVITNIPDSE
jgi:hypothetical protein